MRVCGCVPVSVRQGLDVLERQSDPCVYVDELHTVCMSVSECVCLCVCVSLFVLDVVESQ